MATLTVYVDPRFDFQKRKRIADSVIRYIRKRSSKGRGFNNQVFTRADGKAEYSDAYQKSAEFKASGKSPRPINIDFTGETLDALVAKDLSLAGRIVIGFSNESAKKKSDYMRDKGYNFMTLSKRETEDILSEFNV